MGKLMRARQKLHTSTKINRPETRSNNGTHIPMMITPSENLFSGIDIDVNTLTKKLNDDIVSVKSFKSIKSQVYQDKAITKKEKLKLRREMLLRKIDSISQFKKEVKLRKKRKNNSIIGDTNPLHDALPSLNSLLKKKNDNKITRKPSKAKAIQKSSTRKKNLLHGIATYKKVLKNRNFNKNPLCAVSEHIKSAIQYNS